MNSKEDIKQMMVDVRKAHRLIYQYQNRMLQLVNRIKTEYDLNNPVGRKRFSNPIGTMRRGNDYQEANLRVHDKWAWDMLYSYEFEYYFGKAIRNGLAGCLSVFQISDNGYYMADGYLREQNKSEGHISKEKIEKFWSCEDSSSYFILAFEAFPEDGHRYFFRHPKDSVVSLYGGECDILTNSYDGNKFVAKRYPIEEFFSRESVNETLTEFANLVRQKTSYSLIPE